jgi:hypothetical protein
MGTGVEEDGSFTIRALYASTASFTVHARGYVTLSIEDYELPADDTPVEFRLERGHDVTVRVSDRKGRPVQARVYAQLPGEILGSLARKMESETGTYLLRDLPGQQVVIEARVHGVNYRVLHDALAPELTIEVPVLGALEAKIQGAAQLELDAASCHLWLFPQDGTDLVRRFALLDPTGQSPVLLPDILPGTYHAVLRRWHRPEEIPPELSDTWFEDFPGEQFEELTPLVPVTIRPTETTCIELGR